MIPREGAVSGKWGSQLCCEAGGCCMPSSESTSQGTAGLVGRVDRAGEPVAHVRPDAAGGFDVHRLSDHLDAVAGLASEFARPFGNDDWAFLAGLWHDLGKYKADFQSYIRDRSGFERDEAEEGGPGKVDHTTAGAIYALERLGPKGRILAYLIGGHHSGLPDWIKAEARGRGLSERLADDRHLRETLAEQPPARILSAAAPTSVPCGKPMQSAEHVHLWLRMLFSCLVDADFLDTEAFMDPRRASARRSGSGLSPLRERYEAYMGELATVAKDTLVNQARAQIRAQCLEAASKEPGLFSLTVPTGGGKTLASMGFALDHALAHGKRRVIVAIPFTSIIEQTADTLRDVFGSDAVVEHHSNSDPERETLRGKLATENWDAPIVVTTNVQLFESLHASRTSRSRKLHNLVDSVLILDEAQMLPPEFLKPILSVLRGLTQHFGTTVVLCTATQPALQGTIGSRGNTLAGLSGVREIMRDPEALAKRLRRTALELREPVTEWQELGSDLEAHPTVLCIVNRRQDCRDLHAVMPEGTIHLSALMCGEHRSEVIARIRARLRAGDPIRVVSTQLVEAGVDLDFPVVYRALAGFDSIAQAAGRCNREGRLSEGTFGRVVVFDAPKPPPPGLLRKGAQATQELLRCHRELALSMSPEAFLRYFELHYGRVNSFDAKDIAGLLAGSSARRFEIQFKTAAARFRMIDDSQQQAIVVWYASERFSSRQQLEELRRFGHRRDRMRRLQR